MVGYVVNGLFAKAQRRVVVDARCMLYEEQGGDDPSGLGALLAADNVGIDEGLQVVV